MVDVKERVCAVFFIVSLLLLSAPSFAADEIGLSVSRKSLTVYTGESGSIDITVSNNQNSLDMLSVSIFPQYVYGIIPALEKYSLVLDPKTNTTFKVYFSIPECAEESSTSFTITVRSLIGTNLEQSQSVILNTIRKYGVCISDLKLDRYITNPGENVSIEVYLSNPSETLSLPVNLQTNVIRDNEIVKRFDDFIEGVEGKTTKAVGHTFLVEKYERPGSYAVETIMKDQYGTPVSSKKTYFRVATINASENPSYLLINKTIKYGLLAQTIEISVKNDGNVPVENLYLYESIPVFMKIFFFPKKEPSLEETKENRIVYSWLIPTLSPGEIRTIAYEVSTWNAVLIFIVVILTVIYVFNYVFTVSLVKTHRYYGPITKEREITVMLEVRNRTRNEIRDVVVRDFVPGVAAVVERFDTLRPMLRKIAGGTEIVWRLDSLAPGDERVLTYRIKPVVDIIGTLKLPKAYIRFLDKKKEVKRVLSKGVYIKAG